MFFYDERLLILSKLKKNKFVDAILTFLAAVYRVWTLMSLDLTSDRMLLSVQTMEE